MKGKGKSTSMETLCKKTEEHPHHFVLQHIFHDYLAGQITQRTRNAYRSDIIDFFNGEITKDKVMQLTPADLNAWRNREFQAGRLMPATINRKLTALKTFYDYLSQYDNTIGNPADPRWVKRLKDQSSSRPKLGLTRTQLQALLHACWIGANTQQNHRDYTIIWLSYICLLRRGECAGAFWGDIKTDQGKKVLHLSKTKGGANDFVPLGKKTLNVLQQYFMAMDITVWGDNLAAMANRPIFVALDNNHWGKALSDKSINIQIQKRARLAGIKGVTAHTLRHTGITHLLEAGIPLVRVQEYARHTDPKTTMKYYTLLGRMKNSPGGHLEGVIDCPEADDLKNELLKSSQADDLG